MKDGRGGETSAAERLKGEARGTSRANVWSGTGRWHLRRLIGGSSLTVSRGKRKDALRGPRERRMIPSGWGGIGAGGVET